MPTNCNPEPQADLAAARERHAEAQAKRRDADQALAEARRVRQSVLDRAGAGELVGPADLAAADAEMRDAGHRTDLAGAVEGACRKAVEKASIAAHHADAEAHRVECSAAIDLHIKDAAALDRAMTAVHAAYAKYDASGTAVATAHNKARIFDGEAPARAKLNPTLAALDVGLHPRAGLPLRGAPEQLRPALLIHVFAGEYAPISWPSVEGHLRSAYARPKTAPAPA